MLRDYLAFTGILLATSISLLSQQSPTPAAGAPSAGRPPQAALQIPNPHYVTIPVTIDVSAPADKVWTRIGKYCDIGEWSKSPNGNTCKIPSGTDGEFGAVRTVGNEVLSAKRNTATPTRRRRARTHLTISTTVRLKWNRSRPRRRG